MCVFACVGLLVGRLGVRVEANEWGANYGQLLEGQRKVKRIGGAQRPALKPQKTQNHKNKEWIPYLLSI